MDPANSSRVPRVRPYSGADRESRFPGIRDYHPLWFHFPEDSARNDLCNSPVLHRTSPTTPAGFNSSRFRLMPVRSPLLRQSRLISLPPGTEMFQFSGFAIPDLCIQSGSIRESQDQSPFGGSPELIAVFHALHRLLVPRHPPCALSSLTTMILSSRTEREESWATFCKLSFPD